MLSCDELISKVRSYNLNLNEDLIRKAYDFAKKAHGAQKRESGEDFFSHPVAVAEIITELRLDSEAVAAALLHDVLEDTNVKPETIEREFGKEVYTLVRSLTATSKEQGLINQDAQNIRKVLLATAKDIRIILIKLADRLHNMRTLKYLPSEKQLRIAKESMDIYAPVAYKLGMYKIKTELEDLAFKFLNPQAFQEIKQKISEKKEERERRIKEIVRIISEELSRKNIEYKIYGRPKSFYSVYRKIINRNYDFSEMTDLLAVRVITKNVDDCYRVLSLIHSLWKHDPTQFKDYIQNPKSNGYQSIHTIVYFQGRAIEVQIRTVDMHLDAEEGVAAHWVYKGTDRDKKFEQKIGWLRQILEWRGSELGNNFVEKVEIDLFKGEIIVFTPKGDPISLPEGATILDFAYEVHTDIGNHCVRAKVNNNIVPLDTKLNPGDVIDIMTQKNALPSRQWLKYVVTQKASSKIRQALGIPFDDKINKIKPSQFRFHDLIEFEGPKDNLKISKCCVINPGDKIIGFKTKDGRISIHNASCKNLDSFKENKIVSVRWKNSVLKTREKKILVSVNNRVGILRDILNIISDSEINILSVNTKNKKGHSQILLSLEVDEKSVLKELFSRIKSVKDVINVQEIN